MRKVKEKELDNLYIVNFKFQKIQLRLLLEIRDLLKDIKEYKDTECNESFKKFR